MGDLIKQAITMQNLTAAWESVAANHGAAGMDGVTIQRWRRDWEARLVRLRRDVMNNTYRPSPLRRFRVRKADGHFRHFGIPTVTDRVLQRAALQVLDDVFEPLFLPCSFGYRCGLGVQDAIARIVTLRDRGLVWVLDADIDECFANIDHSRLMTFVRQDVDDPVMLRLIEQWLAVMQPSTDNRRGLSLGGVISPLLCNIYLHRLDTALFAAGWDSLVRYADDFCVFCASEADAQAALAATTRVLRDLAMALEPHKTQITHFDRGLGYLGVHFERDTYSFVSACKRITVKGSARRIPANWVPEGYEAWQRST